MFGLISIRRHLGFRAQFRPIFVASEHRMVLARFYWDRGIPGDGKGYSNKLSISIAWSWYDLCIGLLVKRELYGVIFYLCLLPCIPIRIHLKRAYGGSFG